MCLGVACVGVESIGDILAALDTAGEEATGEAVYVADGADETAPLSRLTSFSVAFLPEKNSPAVREGSDDGAGG